MMKCKIKVFLILLLVLHSVVAAEDKDTTHPETDTDLQCQRLELKSSQCVHISHEDVFTSEQGLTESEVFETISHWEEAGTLNDSCVDVITALACYYIYPPCHSVRDTQLPLCTKQCTEFIQVLDECYSVMEGEILMPSIASGASLPLTELFQFVIGLNCTQPDSFLVPLVPVDKEECVSMNIYLSDRGDPHSLMQLAEIVVICLAGCLLLLLAVLLLVSVTTLVVVLRKRKRRGKSKVACSLESNGSTLRRLDSPNPSSLMERFSSEEDVNVRSDVQVARMMTDRKRRHYVSLYTGSFIPYQQLELHSVIGEGAFGKVSEGTWRDPTNNKETRVAIKTLRSFSSEQQLNTLFTESRLMRGFDHPNVMTFLGMCFDAPEGYPYIILPFMENGSLLDYLKRKTNSSSIANGFPESLGLNVLYQFCLDIADGMTYLVQQKFVHRDLAARNCMVSETKTILIGDFGLAGDLYSSDQHQSAVRLPVKWMPPESLKDGVSNEKTDMWSYGVTYWEVFSLGRSPYPGIENHEILEHISGGGRLKKPTLCPNKLYDVVLTCWQYNPDERPSFPDIACTLRHYWDTSHEQQQQ